MSGYLTMGSAVFASGESLFGDTATLIQGRTTGSVRLYGRQGRGASLRPLSFPRLPKSLPACPRASLVPLAPCAGQRNNGHVPSPPLRFQARPCRTAGIFAALRSLPLASLRFAPRPASPPARCGFSYLTCPPVI